MMKLERPHLSVLLNRLYDRDEDYFTISHPASEVGDLVRISLDSHDSCTVRFVKDYEDYSNARNEVGLNHGKHVSDDLPSPDEYVRGVMASGLLKIDNHDEIREYVERHGNPDLLEGLPPVVAGFDTNLLYWRIDQVLGLRDPNEGVGYLNGFVLATGVRDELTWENKCEDVDPFVTAFGDACEEYWNQSIGSARKGRLGLETYRSIRDIQKASEIECGRGDEEIISAYNEFERENRPDVMLFSNDKNFVQRAHAHTLQAKRIKFPTDVPRKTTATWRELEVLLYTFAVIFGVIEVPATTIHGVWRGKEPEDWQYERLKLDCRSPKLTPKLDADKRIVETYEQLRDSAG